MDEKRTGMWLRQTEQSRGHLWHRYSETVNLVMVVTVKLSKWRLHRKHKEPLLEVTLYYDRWQVYGSSGYSSFHDQFNWLPWYSWRIVESSTKQQYHTDTHISSLLSFLDFMQNTMHSTLIFYYKSSLKEIRKCISASMCIVNIYFLYFSSINGRTIDMYRMCQ
jgi:hypothetical protein